MIAIRKRRVTDGFIPTETDDVSLIQLKSPWRKHMWLDSLSSDSPLRETDMSEKGSITDDDESAFWMELSDLKRYFK